MNLALAHGFFRPHPWFVRMRWTRSVPDARTTGAASPSRDIHELAMNGALSLVGARGRRVECLRGCIWITVDGDVRDVVLVAGQSLRLDRQQPVLIQALEPSRMCMALADGKP